MKILINISNLLLGRALQEMLEREPEAYQALFVADVRQCNGFRPDFLIVDSCTIRACLPFPDPETKIMLLDFCLSDQEMIALLLTCKIDGIVATTADLPLFKKALDRVMAGQIWIDNNKIKAIVRQGEHARNVNQHESFSKKERDIIMLVSQGLTNKAIADNLHISEQTVKTHLGRIFRKTSISRRAQLVPLAMKLRVQNSA